MKMPRKRYYKKIGEMPIYTMQTDEKGYYMKLDEKDLSLFEKLDAVPNTLLTSDGYPIPLSETGRRTGRRAGYNKKTFSHVKNKVFPMAAKVEAVTCWTALGNLRTVSDMLDIPYDTLKTWRKQSWWDDLAKNLNQEKTEELDAGLTKLIDKSLSLLNDRIENGDWVMTKAGDIKRKPLIASDGVKILNTVFDKRQLVRGKATSINENLTVDERLKKIADQFVSFSKAKVINGKTGEVEE